VIFRWTPYCNRWIANQVACALSYSLKGVYYVHRTGNAETIAAAQTHPQIIPVATLDLREYLGWETEVDRCLKGGFRVFHFFPEAQAWSISSTFFRKVLDRLHDTGVRLIFTIDRGQAAWQDPLPGSQCTLRSATSYSTGGR